MYSLHGRRSTSFGANYFQNQGIHSILRIRKRSYRDAKMKKLEKFWRENAVGIGLCNECVLWWGVRFERLLAALKSKRDKQAQKCIVFGASVRWAFELINASGPGIPTTYGWIWRWIQQLWKQIDFNGVRQKSGSFIATCGLFFQPCWKFTKVLFELINRVRAWRSNRILLV